MKKLFFLVSVLCFHSTLCFAESCTAMPNCAELGYYRGTNIACGDDDSRYIVCPYDPDYRKCINYDCEEMGFIKDGLASLQAWCQNIIFCKKDKSYVLCGDIDGPSAVCTPTYCTAVAVPSNAKGTTSCTPQDIDCEYGEAVYTAWACNPGYHLSEDEKSCDENCIPETCNGIISKPEHAHGIEPCKPKYANCKYGEEVFTSWLCDDGYHPNSNNTDCVGDCEPETCEGHNVTEFEIPANAQGLNECVVKDRYCNQGAKRYTGWKCKDGWHQDGAVCKKDCQVNTCSGRTLKDSDLPEHAYGTDKCSPTDELCNIGEALYRGWECKSGWYKNVAGTECVNCIQITCETVQVPNDVHAVGTGSCKPQGVNCSQGAEVPTGWKCVDGWHKNAAQTGCEENCEPKVCGAAVSYPSETAHCTKECAPIDENCNETGSKRCVEWDCNPGWHKEGNTCVKNVTCDPVTCGAVISTKPAHSHYVTCTNVDSDCSTTVVNTGWVCDDNYHLNSNNTGCDSDCSVVTCGNPVSKPANAEYTEYCYPRNANCSTGAGVGKAWACLPTYHLNATGTDCEPDCQPSGCSGAINTKPAHSHYVDPCTIIYQNCSTEVVYKGWACDDNYHPNSNNTGCVDDCTPEPCDGHEVNEADIPLKAQGVNECIKKDKNCNELAKVYTGWECVSGYHKNAAGTGCDKDPVCTPKYCGTSVTVPSNDPHAYGTGECTPIYSDCSTGTTVYADWACESGYHKNAAGTGCEADCSIQTCTAVTAPSNAHYTTTCKPRSTDCSEGSSVNTAWACNDGYHANAAGTACDKDCDNSQGYYSTCPTGAVCDTSDGCYVPRRCNEDENWLEDDSWESYYISYDTTQSSTFNVRSGSNVSSRKCYLANGCKQMTYQQWVNGNYDTDYFDPDDDIEYGDYHCMKIICAADKNSSCYGGKVLQNTKTISSGTWSLTCGECVNNCDNSQGYYSTCPTGAVCNTSNGCYVPTGCSATNGYVSTSSTEVEEGWTTCGSTAPSFNRRSGSNVYSTTCCHVSGCHNAVPMSTWVNDNYSTWFNDEFEGTFCVAIDNCAGNMVRDSECSDSNADFDHDKTSVTYDGDPITCGVCDCSYYTDGTSTKWIVSQSSTWNATANITKCRSEFGQSYYPTQTTRSCGGRVYRKCEVQNLSCQDIDSDYADECPTTSGTLYNFYEVVYVNGKKCYNKENPYTWQQLNIRGSSSSGVATCTLDSNRGSYSGASAFYVGERMDGAQRSEACRYARDYLGYTKAIIANGFNFDTADSRTCQYSYYEHFDEAECVYVASNGKRYEAHIDASSDDPYSGTSLLNKVAVILSTNESSNDFSFRSQPKGVFECCAEEAYNLNDIPGCSNVIFELDGNKIQVWNRVGSSLGYVRGCGDYDDY